MAEPETITVEDRMDTWALLRKVYLMLSGHAMTWAIVLMSFALFLYLAIKPDVWRFAGAGLFTLAMFPLAWRDKRK